MSVPTKNTKQDKDKPQKGRQKRPSKAAAATEYGGLTDRLVAINRNAKVVKGGRRFSFSALVVAGDKLGQIGMGLGKALEVSEAIKKGTESAKRNLKRVNIPKKAATLYYQMNTRFGASKILLRPAAPGTGIVAGRSMRPVLEQAGYTDVLAKSTGSKNPNNVVRATLRALCSMESPEQVARRRGKTVEEIRPMAPSKKNKENAK